MRFDPAAIAVAVWNLVTLANRTVTTRTSIQRATITLASITTDTVSISSVDTAKASVRLLGYSSDATADGANGSRHVHVDFASATSVRATRAVGTGTVVVKVEVRAEN